MPLKQNKSKIWDVPIKDFKKVIKESRSWNQVVKFYFNHSGNKKTIKRRVEKEKIDTSHFLGKHWSKGLKNLKSASHPKYSLEEILVENSTYKSNQCLKKRLIKNNLLIDKCYICNLLPIWNNKPIVLQVDHINGKHKDNRIENLRLLCPNCHSQTDTFCGKVKHQKTNIIIQIEKNLKIKKSEENKQTKKCKDCKKNISNKSIRCISCAAKKSQYKYRKVKNRPSLENLLELKKTMSMVAIGKKYGVSDNCIRKWIKNYKKDINKITNNLDKLKL